MAVTAVWMPAVVLPVLVCVAVNVLMFVILVAAPAFVAGLDQTMLAVMLVISVEFVAALTCVS
jgi:hypothetical protein